MKVGRARFGPASAHALIGLIMLTMIGNVGVIHRTHQGFFEQGRWQPGHQQVVDPLLQGQQTRLTQQGLERRPDRVGTGGSRQELTGAVNREPFDCGGDQHIPDGLGIVLAAGHLQRKGFLECRLGEGVDLVCRQLRFWGMLMGRHGIARLLFWRIIGENDCSCLFLPLIADY